MRLLRALAMIAGLSAPALASSAYMLGPTISTSTGRVTQSIAGTFNVAASSITVSTPTISLTGATGVVTATSFSGSGASLTGISSTFSGGTVSGQTTFQSSVTFNAAVSLSSITLTGAGGVFTSASSVTASAFFGNGAGLTNIGGATDNTKVAKAGDTMTGALNMNGVAVNLTGAAGNVTSQSSVTASAFFGDGNNLTNLSCKPGTGTGSVNCLGSGNTTGGSYSTVGGGLTNNASSAYGSVGGGNGNDARGSYDTIAGGRGNIASQIISGSYATVGGGYGNEAFDDFSFIGGGLGNVTNGGVGYNVVGGGYSNIVAGAYSVIPGGYQNAAAGGYSFAAGINASANSQNVFVWADATYSDHGPNTFNIHTSTVYFDATGGVYVDTGPFTALSTGTIKGNFYAGAGPHISTMTTSGFLIFPAWTLAQLAAYTPLTTELWGQVTCTDCAIPGTVCQSSGTSIMGFRMSTSTLTGCR